MRRRSVPLSLPIPLGLIPSSAPTSINWGFGFHSSPFPPFSKAHYVSHTIGDHTSILALIERRFLNLNGVTVHLTNRDAYANPLEDMFDFAHSPSLDAPVTPAAPPTDDCTPIRALSAIG